MLWFLFEVLIRLRVVINSIKYIVVNYGLKMKRIDVNYKWLIDDVLNKIDKEKNKFIKVLREFGGVILML